MTSPYACLLDLQDLPVVVFGAGRVATRRVGPLLEAGAVVHVISPRASSTIQALADSGALRLSARLGQM